MSRLDNFLVGVVRDLNFERLLGRVGRRVGHLYFGDLGRRRFPEHPFLLRSIVSFLEDCFLVCGASLIMTTCMLHSLNGRYCLPWQRNLGLCRGSRRLAHGWTTLPVACDNPYRKKEKYNSKYKSVWDILRR